MSTGRLTGPRKVRPTNAVRAVLNRAIVWSGPRSSCTRSPWVLGVTKYDPRCDRGYSSTPGKWPARCPRGSHALPREQAYLATFQQRYEQEAGQEPADVRAKSHARVAARDRRLAQQLCREPQQQKQHGGYAQRREKERQQHQGQYLRAREQQQIRAQHTGYG